MAAWAAVAIINVVIALKRNLVPITQPPVLAGNALFREAGPHCVLEFTGGRGNLEGLRPDPMPHIPSQK
jgi:hypothetical protein